jgi:glucose dehydrogenase
MMKTKMLFVCVALVPMAGLLWADDYPQWRGPDRNGVSKEKGLMPKWPAEGPKLAWQAKGLGTGYSSVAVANGRVYTLGETKGEEALIALNEKDGKEIWSKVIGKVGKNQGPQYPGPRGTPTVDGSRIYTLSSDGDLDCMDANDGKLVWKKNLRTDFKGQMGKWAYAESPLVDGDKVVVTPGGNEATLLALNKNDGSVIWKSVLPEGDQAAYASAIVGEVGGIRQYIQFVEKALVGVDANTGKVLWRYEKTSNGIANIPTPLFHDGAVLSMASKTGAGQTKLTVEGKTVKATDGFFLPAMANQIGSPVRIGEYVYGTGPNALMCIDWATGKVKWSDRSVGTGSVCYADLV